MILHFSNPYIDTLLQCFYSTLIKGVKDHRLVPASRHGIAASLRGGPQSQAVMRTYSGSHSLFALSSEVDIPNCGVGARATLIGQAAPSGAAYLIGPLRAKAGHAWVFGAICGAYWRCACMRWWWREYDAWRRRKRKQPRHYRGTLTVTVTGSSGAATATATVNHLVQ